MLIRTWDICARFSPVIRGDPWHLDAGVLNDDWAYVIFDWDNHFGAYMLSLDAKELGYSALIQVVKSRTGKGILDSGLNFDRQLTANPTANRTHPHRQPHRGLDHL